MSSSRRAVSPATVPRRGAGASHAEQRLAAVAALGLIASMFLPWYHRRFVVRAADRQVETR